MFVQSNASKVLHVVIIYKEILYIEEKHGSTSLQTQKQATFPKVYLHFVYIFASIS